MSQESPELFSIDVSQPSEGTYLLSLTGEMDIASSPELGVKLETLNSSESRHVIVDLSRLTFIDSSGINALVVAAKAIKAEGGDMTLVAPTPHTQRIFEIVHLSDVLSIEESLEAAVNRVATSGA